MSEFDLHQGSLVVEIGSNDGTLLKFFQDAGMKVLGIDPAIEIAKKATDLGIETLPVFFNAELAKILRNERGPASIITANNVFAHVDDLIVFTQGVRGLLAEDGVFIFEVSYLVDVFEKTLFVQLPYLGYCNIYNTLAALATGYSLGIQEDAMTRGLENFQRMSQRNEQIKHKGIDLINDAYNANPKSMTEALKTLDNYKTQGRRIFVIGDMLELGDRSAPAHKNLGEEIAQSKTDILVAVGKLASLSAKSAQILAGKKIQTLEFSNHQEAAEFLVQEAKSGDCVMFKGSRGAAIEKILKTFIVNKN